MTRPSHSALLSEVGGSREKMKPFSVVFYIVGPDMIFIGSWFHCGIVYGKNECLYVSLEVCICLYVKG